FKRFMSSEAVLSVAGFLLASHYRLVGWTNKVLHWPADAFYAPFDANAAVIVALWHGEHFLVPFLLRPSDKLTILVTTHRDGEIVARGCEHFGLTCIRGSGGHGAGDFVRKRAVRAFT